MSSTATLLNAIPIEVTHLDGTKSTVVFRPLTIRQRIQYVHLLAAVDTAGIVALCADKPLEWIDTLTLPSFKGLSKKAFELNFRLALELVEGDPALAAKLAPVMMSLLAAAEQIEALPPQVVAEIEAAMKLKSSADLSPAPATSASAAATGTVS